MFTLACMEERLQKTCFISSREHDIRIGSRPDGSLYGIDNRCNWEKWIVLPDRDNHDFTLIQNNSNGFYLTCNEKGLVSTTKDKQDTNAKWQVYSSPSDDNYIIYSSLHKKWLKCNDKGDLRITDNESWSKCIVEFDKGELCFLSSTGSLKQISCTPCGHLSMSCSKTAWEVFRFIEVGEGSVIISPWKHENKFLCSDPHGQVSTTENRNGSWERWIIIVKSFKGVYIQSRDHKYYLGTNGDTLRTLNKNCDSGWSIDWDTGSACSQEYFMTSLLLRIGVNKNIKKINFPEFDEKNSDLDSYECCENFENEDYDEVNGVCNAEKNDDQDKMISIIKNRPKSTKWKIESVKNEDGYFTFFNMANKSYLRSNSGGQLSFGPYKNSLCKWKIEESDRDSYFLISQASQQFLSVDANDGMFCSPLDESKVTAWNLQPCLPSVFAMNKINRAKSFSEWKDW